MYARARAIRHFASRCVRCLRLRGGVGGDVGRGGAVTRRFWVQMHAAAGVSRPTLRVSRSMALASTMNFVLVVLAARALLAGAGAARRRPRSPWAVAGHALLRRVASGWRRRFRSGFLGWYGRFVRGRKTARQKRTPGVTFSAFRGPRRDRALHRNSEWSGMVKISSIVGPPSMPPSSGASPCPGAGGICAMRGAPIRRCVLLPLLHSGTALFARFPLLRSSKCRNAVVACLLADES